MRNGEGVRYKVSCAKRDCYLKEARYENLGAAEFLAFAHHNRTDNTHRVDVIDTHATPPPSERPALTDSEGRAP